MDLYNQDQDSNPASQKEGEQRDDTKKILGLRLIDWAKGTLTELG